MLERATVLDNGVLRVEIDHATGWLTSLLDRRTGVDLVAGATGEHIQICRDPTDTWGHRVVTYAWPGAAMETTRVVLRENGSYRANLRVERRWHASTLAEEFLLTAGGDALEVRVELDWHEPAHLMKLRIPVALADPSGRAEVPFGSTARPVNGAEDPGQSWIDLTGVAGGVRAGLALVNDAKHGYDLSPGGPSSDGRPGTSPSIGVTVVRSPVFAWHDPTTLSPDGVYSHQDQGFQRFTYALVPHGGDWREAGLHRRAAELTTHPRAMLESFHDGDLGDAASWATVTPSTILVTAIKGGEDEVGAPGGADLIVRAVETVGRRTDAVIDLPLLGARIEAAFEPFRIRTWRVPAAGGDPVEVDLIEWERADPDRPVLDGAVPDGAVPDGAVPHQAAQDGAVRDRADER